MLLPCLGAALLIYAGTARYLGWVLRNPIAVLLGKISYSLYLVHWPIVVFYRYYRTHMLGSAEQIVLAAAAIVVAALMYRFVETPFRVTSSSTGRLYPARTGAACVGLGLMLGLAIVCVPNDDITTQVTAAIRAASPKCAVVARCRYVLNVATARKRSRPRLVMSGWPGW